MPAHDSANAAWARAGQRHRTIAGAPPPRPARGWGRRHRTGGLGSNLPLVLLPHLAVGSFGDGPASIHHPVPGITDGVLDLLPGGRILPAMLIRVPALSQMGLGFVPLASHVVLGRFEAVPIA